MICLVDTHTFIWAISDTNKLSRLTRDIITNSENDIFVSVVSFWEISLKTSIKKFHIEGIAINELPEYARKMNFCILDMSVRDACTFAGLPLTYNHKDPFDRMIIWQSIVNGMELISKDKMFEQYKENGLKLIW